MPDLGGSTAAISSMKVDDPLEDFARLDITLNDVAKRVYVAGEGPAVIVMTEMPCVPTAYWVGDGVSDATMWRSDWIMFVFNVLIDMLTDVCPARIRSTGFTVW